MKIIINIYNLKESIEIKINDENNVCLVDGEKVYVDTSEITHNILNVISGWKPKMINAQLLDGESYQIQIYNNGKIKTFEGRNSFPRNYNEFKQIIDEVVNWKN